MPIGKPPRSFTRRREITRCRSMWQVWLFGCAQAVLIVGSTASCGASPSCSSLIPEMKRRHIPEAAVATFDHEEVKSIFCSTSGSDLAPDSIFEAASLSKPVFAAGVLKLVQQQRLDLDRPLTEYLSHPYEHQQNPFGRGPTDTVEDARFALITARMVLSHTSGLPNWSRRAVLFLSAQPGQTWSYSGEGYVYLQHVVEAITGQPIDIFLQTEVLLPLGMTHSSFIWSPKFEGRAVPGHSTSGKVTPIAQFAQPVVSSTLYTTLGDYSRFVSALLHAEKNTPILMEELPQTQVRPDLNLSWGLGLAIEQMPHASYFHWGANPGFQSFFLFEPDTGRGVLFLTDSDNGLQLVDKLVASAVPGAHPVLRFPMLHPKD